MKDKTVIGIDVGGSTTKIVGFRGSFDRSSLIEPIFVRAADPVTSTFGAFGKFLDENDLSLEDIEKVKITGAGASFITKPIYDLPCVKVAEFRAIGLGGLYLSGYDTAVVASLGTGTALVHAEKGRTPRHLGGTGVGGGTLIGLSKKMLGMDTIEHIEELAKGGSVDMVDLKIGDIVNHEMIPGFTANTTASNFGKISDIATPADIALGIINLVFETIGMVAVFAARTYGLCDVVLTGNLSGMDLCAAKFNELNRMFGMNFVIPEYSRFGTVIGAALADGE